MAVIAVLVSMGVPRFLGYTKDANATALITDARLLESAGLQHALLNDDAFPLGAAVTIVPGSPLANILAAQVPVVTAVYAINEAAVRPFVRSTSNPKADYVMTANGTVFSIAGQENSRGARVMGIGAIIPAPVN